MTTILITGYKSFDMGIFGNKDPRIGIIKKAIRRDLIYLLENGADWFLFTASLGFEVWALEVARELQKDYEFQLATLFLFENQGENWSDSNRTQLELFKQVDFVKYAYPRYENPGQFKQYNQFLINNTDQAYIFYDEENETNLKYLVNMIKSKTDYPTMFLSFERLNEILEE